MAEKITLVQYGQSSKAFQVEQFQEPSPQADEILIDVHYSGINFADILARKGMYDDAPKLPCVIGYDVSGIVSAVGSSAAEKFAIGDRVVSLTRFGGYASQAIAKAVATAKIPDNIGFPEATALATQACTAYYCAVDRISLHPGDRVLVQAAAGGVGRFLVQIAKNAGCIVYGTASTTKQDYIRSLGVDYAIDYTKEDFETALKKSLGKHQLDVVFDSLGGKAFNKAYKLLGPTGSMVCFGAAEQIESEKNKLKLIGLALGFGFRSPISMLLQSKSIITVNMLRVADYKPFRFQHCLTEVLKMAEEKIIRPEVSKIFEAKEVAHAHDFVESRKSTGKVVLRWK